MGKSADRPIWEGHRERLRGRLEREGWGALRPHEMVEIVLYHAVPRQDLSDISRALVDRFGSVGGVFGASREQLLDVEGMTPSLAKWIGLTGELMRAYYDLHAETDIRLEYYRDVLEFLRPRIADASDARLWAIYVDFDFNFLTYTDLREGPNWWDAANVRRMMTEAISNGARHVYMVRWMDGERLEMDGEDMARLESIFDTLRAADVGLGDCLLVGNGEIVSLRMEDKLPKAANNADQAALREKYLT